MLVADLLVRNAIEILTCAGPAPLSGARQGAVDAIRQGSIASRDGRIVAIGPVDTIDERVTLAPSGRVIDASLYSIVPGFVDAHTHAIFAGDRRDELRRRLAGATYADIAAGGGGIVSTVAATRAASEDDLVDQSRSRLDEMLGAGTTTCEVKSGYGLT